MNFKHVPPLHLASGTTPFVKALVLAVSLCTYFVTASARATEHTLPLLPPAGHPQQGLVRVINHSPGSGTVVIEGIDDSGQWYGPVTLELGAYETANFNSNDLETGSSSKGLTGSLGNGQGNWRLTLKSELEIEASAYILSQGGFLSAIDEVARKIAERGVITHHVPIFNPGSNRFERSILRVLNRTGETVIVRIAGRDDNGMPGSGGEVEVRVPAHATRMLTSQELESGGSEFNGRLGDGEGRWQLFVTGDGDIEAMSLMMSRTGHLTNLSSTGLRQIQAEATRVSAMHQSQAQTTAKQVLPMFRPAGHAQQGLARIINHSPSSGAVSIEGIDDMGKRHGPITLELKARETAHFNSDDLERGNSARGLLAGLGNGEGDWRLELQTDLNIEPSAYIRGEGGLLSAMHTVVRTISVGSGTVHHVPIFNGGSNRYHRSVLRIINLADETAVVAVTGRDEEGQGAPSGEVRLSLAPATARTLTAQQLEDGGHGLIGRLGKASDTWQIFVATNASIEVMNLVQTPMGHLTNLSRRRDFAGDSNRLIVASTAPARVRPLQTITLEVPNGLSESDHVVVLDLSGTGAFNTDDTVEVEALTTNEDEILFAAPMTQALDQRNTAHEFALRVKRVADQELSNTLHFSTEDISISDEYFGYSTTILEVILRSLYTHSDDPILNIEALNIRPGLMAATSEVLELETSEMDVQAEAILQSILGVSLREHFESSSLQPHPRPASRTSAYPGNLESRQLEAEARLPPTPIVGDRLREAYSMTVECVAGMIDDFVASISTGGTVDDGRCDLANRGDAIIDAWNSSLDDIVSIGNYFHKIFPKLARKFVSRRAIENLAFRNSINVQVTKSLKMVRTLNEVVDGSELTWDFVRNASGSLEPAFGALEASYMSIRGILRDTTDGTSELVVDAQEFYAGQGLDEAGRDAYSALVNQTDRQRREAENIDDLEELFLGGEDPHGFIMSGVIPGGAVGDSCGPGYEEFVIDEKTSSCVFQSLVERSCFAGSRRPVDVNLGTSDACLYYSLDFIRSDGSCRKNYALVNYQGRLTCRWAELGANGVAWYTLRKEEDDGFNVRDFGFSPENCEFLRLDERFVEFVCDLSSASLPGASAHCTFDFEGGDGSDRVEVIDENRVRIYAGDLMGECEYTGLD